uniref:Uncharacterized protein n=1 Tax=Kapraunia schneideri TaxID=717899 RepID=A0A1Z1MT51_9FLOR|nr:hypothetical protein [Kapraunia schneideri]ARW68945.1 hypothetical protein [Kapraunia schneideri]
MLKVCFFMYEDYNLYNLKIKGNINLIYVAFYFS